MRKCCLILTLMVMALLAGSCSRRPLVEVDNNVLLNITIDTSIANYDAPVLPKMMRAVFFDSKTGDYVSHSFVNQRGGYAYLMPGREYDILVYSFDAESSAIIEGDHNLNDIFACTSPVSESMKEKLDGYVEKIEEEKIVYEPDHLFVGKLEDVYVPVRGYGKPPFEIDICARTVVQTWVVEIDKVHGAEQIESVSGVISGLADHSLIGRREPSYDQATVFLDTVSLAEDGHVYAKFNTFGCNALAGHNQVLSLVFTYTGGGNFSFVVDISDKFKDNPLQSILIETDGIEALP